MQEVNEISRLIISDSLIKTSQRHPDKTSEAVYLDYYHINQSSLIKTCQQNAN